MRVGFLINPVAGMGGRVGLKGTDGVVREALARGARPVATPRALEMLEALRRALDAPNAPVAPLFLVAGGAMGEDCLLQAGFEAEVVWSPGEVTGAEDTRGAVGELLARGVDLVLFCGGDGTARDVCAVAGARTPMLGVPAGVKMFSGVFATTPEAAARILVRHLRGELSLRSVDVADLDEEGYRRGEWLVHRYYRALTPHEPDLTQSAKMVIADGSDAAVRERIADHVVDEVRAHPGALFLLGPGSTVQAVGRALGVDKTPLGIDAVVDGELVERDVDEARILALLGEHPEAFVVVSPIGAQGFVLGRGNQQLSPEVLRRIGPAHVIVIATPAKLLRTPVLHFDTGDRALDAELAGGGHVRVVVGYRVRRMVPAR
ncbi:MAG: ATP-NAD kinase family protein [Myxococcales bacterium]|jgi:predicted polyphosphate/ATP-dependent NAD kinase